MAEKRPDVSPMDLQDAVRLLRDGHGELLDDLRECSRAGIHLGSGEECSALYAIWEFAQSWERLMGHDFDTTSCPDEDVLEVLYPGEEAMRLMDGSC